MATLCLSIASEDKGQIDYVVGDDTVEGPKHSLIDVVHECLSLSLTVSVLKDSLSDHVHCQYMS